MKTPPIVSPQEWEAAREELLVKEKELTRARDALAAERRRMPWMAVEKDYRFEGPTGRSSLADLFEGRRQLIVYRAFYGPEVTTYAEGGSYPERGCVGCSFGRRPGRAPRAPERAGHDARVRLARPAGRDPGPEGAPRLGAHSLVHAHRRLRQGLRGRRVARHQRLHPRRRPDLPHLLHRRPRRRADGQHLELPRHHRARPPGGVGGLAGRLPADAAVPVVELPRPLRGAAHDRGARLGRPGRGAAAAGGRRRGAGGRPGLAGRPTFAAEWADERATDAHDRADLRRAGPARVRRLHERGGHAPLVARRHRTGRRRRRASTCGSAARCGS